ncbi:MAG: response regulator [Dehalococcoidales bacterium]|nr:response regulator [Dehalococcoidales bacterium]
MNKRVLIVEDNPQNMKLLLMTLRPHGYDLLQAVDGEQALEVAIKSNPDLIIMDIQIPKMDGLEVTRRLRQMPAFNQVPIVAVTAYAMKGDREKVIRAGCDAYLPKPINTRQLPGLISGMLKPKPNTNGDGDGR